MKSVLKKSNSLLNRLLIASIFVTTLFSTSGVAATLNLATSPLATSTTTSVKPNLLFVLDDSGSMAWDHMPDDSSDAGSAVTFKFGYFGLRSSQCNQVFYNPAITYLPPVDASGTAYPNASFTAALPDGFKAASVTNVAVNLNTGFYASANILPDGLAQSAYYYAYSGTETTQLKRNYNSTTNTFYAECSNNSNNSNLSLMAPVSGVGGVFNKRRLSTNETATISVSGTSNTSVSSIKVNGVELMSATSTASTSATTVAANVAAKITKNGFSATSSGSVITITGPTSAANYVPVITQSGSMVLTPDVFPDTTAANLTNYANWYSFYRTRMLMMKTAAGRAFSSLGSNYRVGLMKISSSSIPVVPVDTFSGTQRSTWYSTFYGITPSGSTPLRTALSDAGRYYAGKSGAADPMQYSCQQNFTIMSTDGYWNTGNGYKIDGSTAVGNQDGSVPRPMDDGYTTFTTTVTQYTRNSYSTTTSGCSGSQKRLKTQPQKTSCSVVTAEDGTVGSPVCAAWGNNGSATTGSCAATVTLPDPNPSVAVAGSSTTTAGNSGGSSNSLSDVAMYYYQTDLRTPALNNCGTVVSPATVGPLCENNVFISTTDNNTQQHMTTFTLGLGASGLMNYSTSYLTDSTGDYVSVKLGVNADSTASPPICPWQADGTTCNWPLPGLDASNNGYIANVDDLWHAAVDGRGAYFSATDPSSLSDGLANALAGINTRKGAAAAAATSTLNPVANNNSAYVASYTTVQWSGNLESRGINTETGVVSENATWCAENVPAGSCATTPIAETDGDTTIYNCVTHNAVTCPGGVMDGTDCKVPVAVACTGTMGSRVSSNSDNRVIKTANSTGTSLIDFDAAYASANPSYFNAARISTLTQWTSLTASQQTAATNNLIGYLRGQYGYEERSSNDGPPDNKLFRYRSTVLGDTLESQPFFIGKPVFSYPYPGYSNYVTAQSSRAGTVFIGANDGMMHAFAADTGAERWAYVPSVVIPNMWKLADTAYATNHVNFVNGSPIISDVCTANCTNSATAVWKTILVAGLNGGGRGYYALDITVPDSPVLLWELTTTAGIGKIKDDDVGYSYGQPAITQKTNADGTTTWVVIVTSGYNNVSPGDGKGYLYVLNAGTGAIISKISTGVGDTTTPSGIAKISGWNEESAGNMVRYVYGGDLLGNLWRFDLNSTTSATIGTGNVVKFATLFSDSAGANPQPITTTPVLGLISGKRVVFVGTGKYLETSDLSTTQKQTMYAIKDDLTAITLVNARNSLVQQTFTNSADGSGTRTATNNSVDFYTGKGWFIDYPDSGERSNIDSMLVQGTLLFPTIVPSNTACSPGGYGWLNAVNYKTGGAIETKVSYKYDATIVGLNVLYVQGQPKVSVVTSTNPTPEQNDNVSFGSNAPTFTGKRTLWRELIP